MTIFLYGIWNWFVTGVDDCIIFGMNFSQAKRDGHEIWSIAGVLSGVLSMIAVVFLLNLTLRPYLQLAVFAGVVPLIYGLGPLKRKMPKKKYLFDGIAICILVFTSFAIYGRASDLGIFGRTVATVTPIVWVLFIFKDMVVEENDSDPAWKKLNTFGQSYFGLVLNCLDDIALNTAVVASMHQENLSYWYMSGVFFGSLIMVIVACRFYSRFGGKTNIVLLLPIPQRDALKITITDENFVYIQTFGYWLASGIIFANA